MPLAAWRVKPCKKRQGKKTLSEMTPSLLTKVAAGEQSAVTLCVKEYGPLVWSLALRYHRDRHEAEDAVQEAFIDVWKSAHRFDPAVASEKTFVAMIARRRIIDRLRRTEKKRANVSLESAA